MELDEIRDDLKQIRYYYMRKDDLDKAFFTTGENSILNKVKLYNSIVTNAPAKLYDIYISLYINCHTQESLSDKLGFTPEYVQVLNKKLLVYIQSYLNNNEGEQANGKK